MESNQPSEEAVEGATYIIFNTGDGDPGRKKQRREDNGEASKSAAKEAATRGDVEAQGSCFACQEPGNEDHSGKGRGRMAGGKRFPSIKDKFGISVLRKQLRRFGEGQAFIRTLCIRAVRHPTGTEIGSLGEVDLG